VVGALNVFKTLRQAVTSAYRIPLSVWLVASTDGVHFAGHKALEDDFVKGYDNEDKDEARCINLEGE